MKKTYPLIALLLLSGIVAAQTQRIDRRLSAARMHKEINIVPASQTKATVDSLNYDGVNDNSYGTSAAVTFGAYALFPSSVLATHAAAGHYILAEKLYINGVADVSDAELRIYTDTLASALVFSQPFVAVEGWNTITLASPLAVPASGKLYIGYVITATGGFPAGCDAGPQNANGNWIYDGSWKHLIDISPALTYNWNIRALCGYYPVAPTGFCTLADWQAGNVNIAASATSAVFTLSNIGGGTLTCSGISGLSAPFSTTLVPASVSLTNGATKSFTFSYNPTALGTNNQTVVIATNGGNITIHLSGKGTNCGTAINTFPWTENFEGTDFPPSCWEINSPDAGTGWARIDAGTTPIPGFPDGTMTTPLGGGTRAAYCSFETGGPNATNQWLITPKIAVQNNQELSFYVWWYGHFQDGIDVKLSTTTTALAAFSTLLLACDSNQFEHAAWKLFKIPLAAYASQSVYFAFNEHVASTAVDGAFIGIDVVKVDQVSGLSETGSEALSVFPNPASNQLFVAASHISRIEIYNLMGTQAASFGNVHSLDVSGLPAGNYVVKVITDTRVITTKVAIAR